VLKAVVNTVTAVALAGVVVLATQSACAVSNNGPRQGSMEQTQIGVHIPWAIGGDRIERDGTGINHPGEWPDFEVDAIRLWDTRTAWLNPELWGTPVWAAQTLSGSDAAWLGPGSASPP
jgi:hypothetical protein